MSSYNATFSYSAHSATVSKNHRPYVESLMERMETQGIDGVLSKPLDFLFFGLVVLGAFELVNYLVQNVGRWGNPKLVPVRGKHLDVLSQKDKLFIVLNKIATVPFVYFFVRFASFEENVLWDYRKITLTNTILPLPILYVVYDFFYTILHWALHIKAIYGYIHKHHHHQKAPSRANVDAVNVHPIEFFLGEYNHLLTLFLITSVLQIPTHFVTSLLFLAVGGCLTALNHTRYDTVIQLPWGIQKGGLTIYDSKAHDVHHRIPQSNYGQYTMLWDWVFGSYRPYDANDRINPQAQLDPLTGKSLFYSASKKCS